VSGFITTTHKQELNAYFHYFAQTKPSLLLAVLYFIAVDNFLFFETFFYFYI
tara:strand:+ start:5095 stop:5250 length:156 start_codon:yes stop_codon:yes gene_type:complete